MIFVDTNFPEVDYKTMSNKPYGTINIHRRNIITQNIALAGLIQYQESPTYLKAIDKENITHVPIHDVILRNNKELIVDVEQVGPVGNADHATTIVKLNMKSPEKLK